MPEYRPIPVICGPTGSGKTGAAVSLAENFPIEVVSVDSRQLIKRLDVGTAKPTPVEKAAVRFHLIDLIEPGETYTAFRFIGDAEASIRDILSRRRIPVLVGGTGLYLKALTEGVVNLEDVDSEVRGRLETEMEREGPAAMHARLAEMDPEAAAQIHPNNRVRVIRALELFEQTGRPRSELMASGTYKKSSFEFRLYCLQPEREGLYSRINRRVDEMMRGGLLEEVESLTKAGLGPDLRRSNVIGYEELMDFLEGHCSLDEAVEAIKQNSRRYAKRQMTWFRHQADCKYYEDREALKAGLSEELSAWDRLVSG